MATKTNQEREEIIDSVIDLVMMGFDKPYQIQKMMKDIAKWQTAKSYLDEAKRRIAKIYDAGANRERTLKKELVGLQYMERKCWEIFGEASSYNERTGAIRTILSIKERRAKLLSLDTDNLKITSPTSGINVAEIARIVAESEAKTRVEPDTGEKFNYSGE